MGSYRVAVTDAKRTHFGPNDIGDPGGSYHGCAAGFTVEARNAVSAMQIAVDFCRAHKIVPCEIRLEDGPDIEGQ